MSFVHITNSHSCHAQSLSRCDCMQCNHVFSFCWPANACSLMRIGIPTILCKDIALLLYVSIFNSISCLMCHYLSYYCHSHELTSCFLAGVVWYRHGTKPEHG